MGRQFDEAAILNLLDDLQKAEIYTRNEAIKAVIKQKIDDPRIVDRLIQMVAHDSSKSVRNFARSALDRLGVEYSEVEEDEPVTGSYAEVLGLKLLKDLQSKDIDIRAAAVEKILEAELKDERIIRILIDIAGSDTNVSVRNLARNTLDWLQVEYALASAVPPTDLSTPKSLSAKKINETKNKASSSDAQKRRDFWSGFWGWFGLNLIVLVMGSVLVNFVASVATTIGNNIANSFFLWVISLAINFGVMIYYGTHNRSQVVIGMLAAFGATFTICLALSAVCFSSF